MTAAPKHSPLVERVARAICFTEDKDDPDADFTPVEGEPTGEKLWELWVPEAKNAIATCHVNEMRQLLRKAEQALSSSYDSLDYPADGTSTQEITASEIRALLAKLEGQP